jgi:hypothetical protein
MFDLDAIKDRCEAAGASCEIVDLLRPALLIRTETFALYLFASGRAVCAAEGRVPVFDPVQMAVMDILSAQRGELLAA